MGKILLYVTFIAIGQPSDTLDTGLRLHAPFALLAAVRIPKGNGRTNTRAPVPTQTSRTMTTIY